MTTTVVGLFEDSRDAHRAVSALLDAGFSRETISLVASDASNQYSRYLNRPADELAAETDDSLTSGEGAGFGAVVGALTGVLVGLTALAIPGVGPGWASCRVNQDRHIGVGSRTLRSRNSAWWDAARRRVGR
jgi:hypothetical protein